MTEQDKEIQELRRRLEFLEKKNKELEQIHQLDMAEIIWLRRQIERMEEQNNG